MARKAEESYWETLRDAGFGQVQFVARHALTPEELEAMPCCPGEEFTPPPAEEDLGVLQGKVASVKFTALRNYLKTLRRHHRRYQMSPHASCNIAR